MTTIIAVIKKMCWFKYNHHQHHQHHQQLFLLFQIISLVLQQQKKIETRVNRGRKNITKLEAILLSSSPLECTKAWRIQLVLERFFFNVNTKENQIACVLNLSSTFIIDNDTFFSFFCHKKKKVISCNEKGIFYLN